jgi:hypothetical protein
MLFADTKRAILVALTFAAMSILVPMTARADVITLECSGGVEGTFLIDQSIETAALYEDRKATYMNEVAISDSTITFTEDHPGRTVDNVSVGGTSSTLRIDRKTGHVEAQTYNYLDGKITGQTISVGQCKQVPNPK